ncbi:MAG: hypothetical protein AAF909_10550 [Pseudomonadota bacterium]
MIVSDNISLILIVTGGITMLAALQYVAPAAFLKATLGRDVEGPVGRFYAQGWGAAVGVIGLALVLAGLSPDGNEALVLMGLIGKAAFVALVLASGGAFLRGHAFSVVLDVICVTLYGLYLTQTL